MLGKIKTWMVLGAGTLVLLVVVFWPDRSVIVPGERVGKYRLRQPWVSHQSSYVVPATEGLILTFTQEHLEIISVLDEKYHTAEGLRIGTTTNSLISAYGKPDRIDGEFWYYDMRGLELLCRTGAVSLINVSSPTNR